MGKPSMSSYLMRRTTRTSSASGARPLPSTNAMGCSMLGSQYSTSFSSATTMCPSCSNKAAVTPEPARSCPENVPSYMWPRPHDGLLDFRIARLTPHACAISSERRAPSAYARVTSTPSAVTIRSPHRSAGGRGQARPPRTSGQAATTALSPPRLRKRSAKRLTAKEGLTPPS